MRFGFIVFLLLCLSFLGFGQCTLNVNLFSSSPAICSGTNAVLTASASGGTPSYTYSWSTGETTSIISVNKAGTYTVTVTDQTSGCPGVTKSVVITSSVTPAAPAAGNVATCQFSSATITASGSSGTYQWYDAPTGGNFLASGASYTTPPLANTAVYFVETTVTGCTSPRTAVYAFIYGAPGTNSIGVCAGNIGTVSAQGYSSYIWYDAPTGGNQIGTGATFTSPPLTNTTTYYVAGVINACITPRSAATVYVTPAPQPPTASGATICAGSAISLHADVPAGIIDWFDVPVGGTSLITSPDFTTPPLSTTTTYYVQNSSNGCVSARTPVTVTVNPIAVAPTSTDVTTCYGTGSVLTASSSTPATFQWFARSTGGTALATGNTFTTPVLTRTTTYYVEANNGGCNSPRMPVKVIINVPPDPPTASDALICSGSATVLTATAPGGNYEWYDASTGGNLLASGANFTTPILTANTVYYLQTTAANGCVSDRAAINVNILPVTTPPTASTATICYGDAATLIATGAGNYQWYDAATGGNKLSDAQVYITQPLTATTTYYVQTMANGCVSNRTAVTVTVNPTPVAPTAGTVTAVCPGSPSTLTASATGTITWYDAAADGNLLATGNSYTTPPLTANTTYYAQNTTGTCVSPRTAVTATVNNVPNPQFKYPSATVCTSSANITPTIYNPAGGTFSASPAGLVFVSNTTGEINVAASTLGTYTLTFTGGGACPTTNSITFAISTGANATFFYNGPFCQDGINPVAAFPASGGSGGNFTSSPGLVFINTNTGEIDLKNSTPGTYIVTNTILASGSCPAAAYTSTLTINPAVIVSAGQNQTVGSGSAVQLAGSITGGTTTGTWSGGLGAFSNPSLPNAVYTPAAGETSAVLTLTSADPPGVCGPKSATITITFTSSPTAPTVANASICIGTGATLSAIAPGGNYQWYDTASGNNLLATGPNFTTPALTATTTYYVLTTINGITSLRTPVIVTVNTSPTAPVVTQTPVCIGTTATLTANSPGTVTYEWYSVAAGGNLLATGNTFVTRKLIANTTYFVQASANGCSSPRTQVDLVVNPLPDITSADASDICSGNPLNYTITADVPAATFMWSRNAVAGISNATVSNQATGVINETLLNTTTGPIDVTYTIYGVSNGCTGPAFTYIVTVYPTPVVTSATTATICNGSSVNYTIAFSLPQTGFSWSRAVVAGINNQAVSGQTAGTIREVLVNTTNAPIDVIYAYNYIAGPCAGAPFNLKVTVNPSVNVTSAGRVANCSGIAQPYAMQSNVPSATFTWSRGVVPGISNAPVGNQTSATINEALNNTTGNPIDVPYTIYATAFGCTSPTFTYITTVNPIPVMPVANGNSPVCVGSTVQLRTATVNGATYLWTGPNGYTSSLQNPDILNVTPANTGNYTLTVITNGCSSPAATVAVVVDEPPIANAGASQTACANVSSVQLAGSVTGGTTTGIWTTAGNGTFSPSATQLNAQYIPSAQDKTNGSVLLTLVSTSKDDCAVSSSTTTITFGAVPAAEAGPDQEVCAQTTAVQLNGKILISNGGIWITSGKGTFSPSANQLDAVYIPGPGDVAGGSVTLTLTAAAANSCYISSDQMTVKFIPPPTLSTGGTRYVLHGRTIVLGPTVSDEKVTYFWSPNIGISDVTAKHPTVTATISRTYTLTVTDSRGCVSVGQVPIVVQPEININNVFTPNGDGINDTWTITGLIAYENAQVNIFNRNGAKLFYSKGYSQAWDGTYNGQPLPAGVYYYVIDTKLDNIVLTGAITIIR